MYFGGGEEPPLLRAKIKGQGAMPLAQVQGARSPLPGLGRAQAYRQRLCHVVGVANSSGQHADVHQLQALVVCYGAYSTQ